MKRKDIVMLLVPSLIFVIAWIGFSVWHSIVTSTISEVLNIQIAPISGTFDTKVIEGLKKRSNIAPVFDASVSLTSDSLTPTPTPTITIPPVSSESAEQSTEGGSLSQ